MRLTILTITLSTLFFAACSDSDDNESMPMQVIVEAPDTEDESASVLAGDSVRVWANESFELGVFGDLECRNDDVFTFFNDGTYQYDGGSFLCGDMDDEQIVTGTWELDFDNGMIVFDKGTDRQAEATYIVLRDDLIRVQGSWNSIGIDASYIRN